MTTGRHPVSTSRTRLPVVFVSHGAPDALFKAPATVACWQQIGQSLPQPESILVLSAHWEAAQATASLSPRPETLHDFSGFDRALYDLRYPAPGAPALGQRVVELLNDRGLRAATHPTRGLDHGAWVPLMAMVAQADLPVTQLALPHGAAAADFLALGQALAPLRDEGVLIIASGAITHNFGWLRWNAIEGDAPLPQAQSFADWVGACVSAGDTASLINFRQTPLGKATHPTDEHFVPFLVALGAAGNDLAVRHQPPFTYDGLSMDAYVWGANPTA